MWLSSTSNTTNIKPVISEEITTPKQEINAMENIDVLPSITYLDDGALKSVIQEVESCSLKPIKTDVFSFGDAFHYYRKCLGSDSSFQWQGSNYTTLLAEEVIMLVSDSVQVIIEDENNYQASDIR